MPKINPFVGLFFAIAGLMLTITGLMIALFIWMHGDLDGDIQTNRHEVRDVLEKVSELSERTAKLEAGQFLLNESTARIETGQASAAKSTARIEGTLTDIKGGSLPGRVYVLDPSSGNLVFDLPDESIPMLPPDPSGARLEEGMTPG